MQYATPQQTEKALRLCDMLGLDDIDVAISILQQMEWDLEKALNQMLNTSKNAPSKPEPVITVPSFNQNKRDYYGEDNYEYQQYNIQQEQQYTEQKKEQDIQKKKQSFDIDFEQMKLNRTATQPPIKMEKRLSYDRRLIDQFKQYRHTYQAKLLQDSQKFYQKVLQGDSPKLRKADESIAKNQNNRLFLSYLLKNYRTNINFTFGTFKLNLARSYLDKRYLLVYIHSMQFQDSRSVRMILANKESAKIINKYCVSYGMFDNSDDYQIIQKYVPMKQVPCFAIFKYNPKDQKEKFIASYQILQKQPENFFEWVAKNIEVAVSKKKIQEQKKQKSVETTQKQQQKSEKRQQDFINYHRNVMTQQNLEYEQMQKKFKMKRIESKIKKQKIQAAENAITKMKQKFVNQQKCQSGKTIQFRFRLPYTGKSIQRNFQIENEISQMFDYVNCFGRDQFEQRFADFDLTQTFPKLSLKDQKQKKIKQVFQDSAHQNIIVKEL